MLDFLKISVERLLPKSKLVRSVGVLAGGTAGAQVLLVLAAPLLTRLYTPEDFGVLAVYTSMLTLISVIASLRYELAIPLPDNDREAASVAVLCLFIVSAITGLAAILVMFLGQSIAEFLDAVQLVPYLWLLPIGVFASGVYAIFTCWGIRIKNFQVVAATKVWQAVATIAIQVSAFKFGCAALLVGQTAGHCAGTFKLASGTLRSSIFRRIDGNELAKVAKQYRKFPLYSTWEGLTNSASLQIAPLALSALFSPAAAGVYSLAYRCVTMPLGVVSGAIAQVFLSVAATHHREKRLQASVLGIGSVLARVAAPPLILMVLFAPDAFSVVFGEEWRPAGATAAWMAPWIYCQFIYSPVSSVFAVTGNLSHGLAAQTLLLLLRGCALVVGWIVQASMPEAIAYFCIASALGYLICLAWVFCLAGVRYASLAKIIVMSVGFSFASLLPVITMYILNAESFLLWTAGTAAASLFLVAYFRTQVKSALALAAT